MRIRQLMPVALALAVPLAACSSSEPVSDGTPTAPAQATPAGVPIFTTGDAAATQRAEELSLTHVLEVDPTLTRGVDAVWTRGVNIDKLGQAHTRLIQTLDGVPVFGVQSIVHLAKDGSFLSMTDNFRRNLRVNTKPTLTEFEATDLAIGSSRGWAALTGAPETDLQILPHEGRHYLTYRVQLRYLDGADPTMPVMFIDAHTGDLVWSYDNLQTARDRRVHNTNHSQNLPGALARTEGAPPNGDVDVDTNYDRLGSTYDCYFDLFGRDSFDDAGATLISTVHFGNNFVNAFWDGTQMVYGDGDNVNSISLALSMDVTAHELTHAVTELTSDLIYANESGGLNESMSDIFGNVCEWYRDNDGDIAGPTSVNNYLVGEDIWLADLALRFMADPVLDGVSLDFWTPNAGNVDVHFSSGISNLAFFLLAEGGTHPRGKSTNVVTGIGIHDAAQIFFRANTVKFGPSTSFGEARLLTKEAAEDLFGVGSVQATQVENAWTAVGVEEPPDYQVIDTQSGLSGNTGSNIFFGPYDATNLSAIKFVLSGGTGDADLYVRFGAQPTLTQFDCRPFLFGNEETCEFNPAQVGNYFVMINAFDPYAGTTLTVFGASDTPPEVCDDGTDNDGDGDTDCNDSDCAAAPICQAPVEICDDGADNDNDGAIDCADTDCAGDPVCITGDFVVLSFHDFESGLGPYTDGGDDMSLNTFGAYAHQGTNSALIRDNSGAASSFFTTTGIDVSGFNQLKIDFWFIARSMEAGEDFFVEVFDGTDFVTVGTFVSGTDFDNDGFVHATLLVNGIDMAFATDAVLRFRNDASGNNDYVYIDEIELSAR